MEMESMKRAFLDAENADLNMENLGMSLNDISDICIVKYRDKYGTDTINSVKLAEEIDELMTALATICPGDEDRLRWRLSDKWFNLVEEIEDVDIMLHIVNRVLNTQLNTQKDLIDQDICGRKASPSSYIQMLGIENQVVLKGSRKQFSQDTAVQGREMIQSHLDRIYSIIIAIQCRFYIRTTDIRRMRYVKTVRLLNRYGYDV